MRAAKIDANQPEIVAALRAAGCKVQSLAGVGDDFPDLLVGRHGRLLLMEVKNGPKAKVSPGQLAWHAEWAEFPVYIVRNVEEALWLVRD